MTAGVVLDASVVLKLVLVEEFSDRAEALFMAALNDQQTVHSAPSLPVELLSAFYQRARRRDPATAITFDEAEKYLHTGLSLAIDISPPPGLYERTFAFAHTHSLPSTYDAVYVALAEIRGLDLWVADRRLINALATAAPWVRWIGDYPLPQPDKA